MNLPLKSAQDEKELAVETAVSDLFFNMDHRDYRVRKQLSFYGPSDLQETIENDAIQMRDWLSVLGHEYTVEQLVNDFFEREEAANN